MKDTLTCALRELVRRKNRTGANILGYGLAVALMIILAGGLLNSKQNADAILNNTGTHFVAFLPSCMGGCLLRDELKSLQENEGFVANGIPTNLISMDFIEEVRKLPSVKDAAPFLLFQFKNPNDSLLVTLGGFDPRDTVAVGTNCCAASDMVEGRFLTPQDTAGVMVEEAYARLKRIKINDSIDVGGEAFTAIGIVNSGIRPMKANLYLAFQSAEKVINKRIKKTILKNQANVMLIEAENANVHDSAVKSIKEVFPSLVFSSYNCYKPASKVMGLNAKAAWSLIAVVAIATLVLSLRSQFSTVIERRRDIGILKSIGWSNWNVVCQILVESAIQSVTGGILGCLVAFGWMMLAPDGISGYGKSSLHFSDWMVLVIASIGISLFGGLIAGVIPAFWAARKEPAEMIKSL